MHEQRSNSPFLLKFLYFHLHSFLFFSAISAISAVESLAGPAPTPLFNGKDLTGWQPVNGNAENWSVEEDGILSWHGGEGARWIATDEEFDNFLLRLEFNYAPGANSGVFFRTPLVKKGGRPAYEGNEIQIVDEAAAKEAGRLTEHRRMGALYTVAPPTAKVAAPPDQWHRLEIRCIGSFLTVTLNETVVLDTDLAGFSDELKKEHPGLLRKTGHIGLQSKPDSKIKFRNIFVSLPPGS